MEINRHYKLRKKNLGRCMMINKKGKKHKKRQNKKIVFDVSWALARALDGSMTLM